MPDIEFGSDGKCIFKSKYHGELSLSKTKWDRICEAPERFFYRFNAEKIATTLINPDSVRHHRYESSQFLYYKRFTRICSDKGVEGEWRGGIFFAVVIDVSTQRICTVYPVENPKPGKQFVPSV